MNTLVKGLYTDNTPENQPQDTSPYLLNWNHSKVTSSITNEESTEFLVFLSENFLPIGKIVLANERIVIFSRYKYDDFQTSEIGILNKGRYSTLVRDSQLGFELSHQISGEFKVNISGEEVIYWLDNLNPVRYLNLTTLNNSVNTITKLITDIDNFRLFPVFNAADISLQSVNDVGGNLSTGVYYATYAYLDANSNPTNFNNISGQISVTSTSRGTASQSSIYGIYDGDIAGTATTKSFTVLFTDLDSSYQNIRIAIIKVVNSTPTVVYLDVPIVNQTVTFTYTGNETTTVGSLSEILVDRPSYKTGKDIKQYNSQLYIAGPKGQKELGYQKYANNIKVKYVEKTTKLDVNRESGTGVTDTNKDEVIIFDELGFMDDEVYAFYIAFLFKDGSWSRAYHIPGRASQSINNTMHGLGNISDETDTVAQVIANEQLPGGNYGLFSIKSYLDGGNYSSLGTNAKFYQVFNTALPNGTMGFWSNDNEVYPDTDDFDVYDSSGQIGTLRNTNVRHHKFPNPSNIFCTTPYYTQPTTTTAEGRVLGISLNDIYIPDDIKEEVQGYGIFYASRDYKNSTVISQGFPLFPRIDGGPNNLRPNGVNRRIVKTNQLTNEVFQFSGFDLMTENIRVTEPVFMKNEFTVTGRLSMTDNNYHPIRLLSNYNTGIRSNNTQSKIDYIRQITAKALIPHNNDNNNIAANGFTWNMFNESGQKTGLFQIQQTNVGLTVPANANSDSVIGAGIPPGTTGTLTITGQSVYGYLTNLYAFRQNVYNQFDNQVLRFTGQIVRDLDSTTSPDIYGGDTYYNSYGFRGTGDYSGIDTDQIRNINYCFIKSYYHTGYRVDGPDLTTANQQDFYYPKQSTTDVNGLQVWAEEKFIVNKDYSLGNYLNPVFPRLKLSSSSDEDYSTRVIRSETDNPESLIDNFRVFLANNYKDLPRDRGAIWRLETYNNVLLVHHLRTLRRTIGTEDVDTSTIAATLGTGDIFSLEPKELIQTSTGYGGTQSQWGGIVTPYGYFYTDVNSGNVFLLNQGLNTISDIGMLNFFQDNLPLRLPVIMNSRGITYQNIDNPASPYGIGVTCFYDNKYKRIIVTKRDFEPLSTLDLADFTASFGSYVEGQLLYSIDTAKFYVAKYKQTSQVNSTTDTITDSFGPFSQVLELVDLDNPLYFKNLSYTISYYPELKIWGSYYSYLPKFMFNDLNHCYSSIDDRIFRHNLEDNYCTFYNTRYNTEADVTFNDIPKEQKTYGSASWITKSDNLGVEQTLDTFTSAILYNSNQCSGVITLQNLDTMRRAENQWNLNKFRDIATGSTRFFNDNIFNPLSVDTTKRWYDRKKFQDRYLVARLIYDNSNQNRLVFILGNSDYQRISYR